MRYKKKDKAANGKSNKVVIISVTEEMAQLRMAKFVRITADRQIRARNENLNSASSFLQQIRRSALFRL
jgi:hypothetical protein